IVFSTLKLVALTSVTLLEPELATKNRVPLGNAVTETGLLPTAVVPSRGMAGEPLMLMFDASKTLTVLLPLLVTYRRTRVGSKKANAGFTPSGSDGITLELSVAMRLWAPGFTPSPSV